MEQAGKTLAGTGTPIADVMDLKALNAQQLEAFVLERGEPRYRGRQIYRWLYVNGARSFDAMSDLPAALRESLRQTTSLQSIEREASFESRDGTIKTLYRLASGSAIETVLIPDFDLDNKPKRLTVCVSSQVGCVMNCSFCATGRMGFIQNLTSGEIFDQVFETNRLALEKFGKPLSNIVYMGMGEPFLNYEAVRDSIEKITDPNGMGMAGRRITVSTVGLAGQIRRMADEKLNCNLAVSIHAPTDDKRSAIMPVNRKEKTDLSALRAAIKHYASVTGKQVTYEYCLFENFNDGLEDASDLAEITRWVPSKVNLIMYNPVEGVPFGRTGEQALNRFVHRLVERGVTVTVRRSRGQDIKAACGQLALDSASK